MQINDKGKDLIKQYEGLRLTAYKCPAGIWTIGYGHTLGVEKGDKITKQKAEQLFDEDIAIFSDLVRKSINIKLNDNQFSALVSLAYNIGIGAFRKSSTLKLVNEGRFLEASISFMKYCFARVNGKLTVLEGLAKRRKAEKELFEL